ncbi:MAG: DUF5050 domain-containing protein [Herbinix sp.]|nr:DUF5050 domain-containing protein [Herbinix sp.]
MLSSVKRVLIILTIITVAAILGLYFYTKDRTYFNKEAQIGNTTGNIYNGGLFCEQDNTIFFNNLYDNGSLYRMDSVCSNIRKVSEEKAVFINADNNYIYYINANSMADNNTDSIMMYNNSGVYRIDHNGSNLKAFTGNPSAYLILSGNYLYFPRYDVNNGINLYQYKIDASENRPMIYNSVIPIEIMNNAVYYTRISKDSNIGATDLSSHTSHTYYNGSFLYPIFFGDYIYYINKADHKRIYRMNADGSNPTLLIKKSCSTYNITNSGKYLYYQIDGTSNNRIGRLNLETLKSETVMKGNYKHISVTENYVFFTNSDNTIIYKILADGGADASILNTIENLTTTPSPTLSPAPTLSPTPTP